MRRVRCDLRLCENGDEHRRNILQEIFRFGAGRKAWRAAAARSSPDK